MSYVYSIKYLGLVDQHAKVYREETKMEFYKRLASEYAHISGLDHRPKIDRK